MRGMALAAMAALAVMGCDQIQQKLGAPKAGKEAQVAPAPAKPAPMTPERLAVCAAALDAWGEAGAGRAPADVSAEDARQAQTLIGMRKMEVALADSAATDAAVAKALAGWKDKTPADIEAGAAICMKEIKG